MTKRIDFHSSKESRLDEKIESTLNTQFVLPELIESAKNQSFEQIREKAVKNTVLHTKKKKFRKIYKILTGAAAAAAVFSAVCITNPAWAAKIPLIGSVFKEIGDSLGFSGDYTDYAKPLEQKNENMEDTTNKKEDVAGEKNVQETAYSKTVDGVTITLSEVYCNERALYLSMLIESEEPFPETFLRQDHTPSLDI